MWSIQREYFWPWKLARKREWGAEIERRKGGAEQKEKWLKQNKRRLKQWCGLNWKRFWAEAKTFGLKKKTEKRLGWKKCFWAEKNVFGLKKRAHLNWNEKKGRKKKKQRGSAETEKGREQRRWSWKKERAGTENFLAIIFLQIFSEKLWWIRLCWI